jgi:alanyl-tRNA synthetase
VPDSVLSDIEAEVNDVLLADMAVRAFVTTQEEAKRIGALAMFGEKYGDAVRVVEVGEYSRELCGGTHAVHSAQLGLVKLLSEASIGTGKRRIEGLVGADAYTYLAREHLLVSQLTDLLKATPDELVERVGSAISRVRELEKDLEKLRAASMLSNAGDIAASAAEEHGVAVVVHHAPDGATADDLRSLVLDVRNRLPEQQPAVVAAAAVTDARPVVVVATNDKAREWGLSAGTLVREAAQVLGGGGGGRDDVAQGGGSRPEAIGEAMVGLRAAVGRQVTAGG